MALLFRNKYWYLVKAQRQSSSLSTKTLVWLVTVNILILGLVSYYFLWNTFRVIEQEAKITIQSSANQLNSEITKVQNSQLDVGLSPNEQIRNLDLRLSFQIDNLRLSAQGLRIGYYDIALDTFFIGRQDTSSIISLEPGSEAWQNYQNGQPTWYKTTSTPSWAKDGQVYISPVKQGETNIGYIWSSLESPSLQFFTSKVLLSSVILIILATILLILIWHLFMRKVNQTLIKTAQQIAKDPSQAHREFGNPIFKPFKSYLESLHSKWLQAEHEYQAIERFHWMSEISAAVSHEIRNPLTTVRGFLQLFQTKAYLTEEDKEILQLMISELDHSTLLIKDFLDVTKPATKEIEIIHLKDTLVRLIRVIEALALGHNVQINLELPQHDTYIQGNLQSFRQVMINLLQNAIQALPSGGNIKITVLQYEKQIQIQVHDNGVGMDQETLRKLGKPFFTTKENGTGLGLPMCIHLVEQMNGKLDFTSVLGEGTVFTLTFPTVLN